MANITTTPLTTAQQIAALPQQQAAMAAQQAAARQQYGVQTASPAQPIDQAGNAAIAATNQGVGLNPYSVQQFQQMYAQNPAMALKMYEADQAAGGKSAINTAMGWGNQPIGTTPGAAAFIQKYSAGGTGYKPGLSLNGLTGQFAPAAGSYIANYLAGQNTPSMSNVNSQVQNASQNNGPYGAGYTGFGNSVEAGPSPTGPTNLPTGPGVGTSTTGNTGSSSNGVSSGTPNYSTGPDNPIGTGAATAAWTPPAPTPAGTPMGGPGTAGIGAPSIGPAPTPTPTPSNAGGGYAGTNISNSNYNNRFGTSARPV